MDAQAADESTVSEGTAAKENRADNNMDDDDRGDGRGDRAESRKIKITVQAQGRADVVFEVNPEKKILKLMTAYANATVRILICMRFVWTNKNIVVQNSKVDGLRFFNMDNERLHKFDTYKEKNIQNGDIIEVRMEQEGGADYQGQWG